MDIDNLTLDEINNIQRELDKRKTELKLKQIEMRQDIAKQHIDIIRKYKDVILPLIEHDRSSCSDENPCNGFGSASYGARCNKCHLIEILDGQYGNEFDVKFEVVIIDIEE